jgi:sensor c-di-GMP phosphodiesterase-like protein
MKLTLKMRVLMSLAAIVAATACGLLAGFLLGRAIALRLAEGRLHQLADRLIVLTDTAAFESHALLDTLNASPHPYCSGAEIAYFRALIFHSKYLKDAGRMRGGKIDCSAAMGRLEQPITAPAPDYIGKKGIRVYNNLAAPSADNLRRTGLQMGDSYVLYSPWILSDVGAQPLHLTMTQLEADIQRSGWVGGESPQVPISILTRNGRAQTNDTLYITRCSSHFFNCITAYASIPEALQASRGEMKVNIALGGLTGALFGVLLFSFYGRVRNMEQQLRWAIRHDRLRAVYQQIVSLTSGRIVGAEALARWTDEEGFAVGPDVFVKMAEELGFVGSITRLMVRHVLRDFAATLRAYPDFRLSINVAATDLADPRFLPMLERALKRAGVAARSVVIEITEGSTARHEMAIAAILRLRQLGHSVHIDDFGTGYSSLAYLHDLSVDAVKIDKTFTRTVGTEAVTAAILPQILAMVEALGLQVIVEGIETSQQVEYFAAQAQPILGQGWFFGRAVAAEEFLRLLAEDKNNAPAGAGLL